MRCGHDKAHRLRDGESSHIRRRSSSTPACFLKGPCKATPGSPALVRQRLIGREAFLFRWMGADEFVELDVKRLQGQGSLWP
jgi:hypothetical protein